MSEKLHTPRRGRVHPGSLFIVAIAAALWIGANLAPRPTSDLESLARSRREAGEPLRSPMTAGAHTDYGFPCVLYRSYDSRTTLITTDGQIVAPLQRRSGEWHSLGLMLDAALCALLLVLLAAAAEAVLVRWARKEDAASALALPEV